MNPRPSAFTVAKEGIAPPAQSGVGQRQVAVGLNMLRIFTQHAVKKLHLNRASEAPAREHSLLTPREEIHSFPCH